MCGIVGEFRFDGLPAREIALREQLRLLHHRGPDSSGSVVVQGCALGHTRLAIQDLTDCGAQPMRTPDHRYTLVYNGELYNRAELIDRFGLHRRLRGHSDTECLLWALVEHGEAAIPALEGMYAFAFVDHRDSTLLLARDPLGIKPLYVHQSPQRVVFSSEIKPLLVYRDVPRAPDYAALRQSLLFGYTLDPDTAFVDIKRLSPGTWRKYDPKGVARTQKFWSVESAVSGEPGAVGPTLSDSVRSQLISDVPTGLLLSGGVDSTLMLALIARDGGLPRDFACINVGADPDDANAPRYGSIERRLAASTARHFGCALLEVDQNDASLPSLDESVCSVEEPISNPSNGLIDLVAREARARGTFVLLSGHGGDEVFAGYRRHLWARYLPLARRVGLPHLLHQAAARYPAPVLQRMSDSLSGHAALHPLISVGAVGWSLVSGESVAPDWFPASAIAHAAAGHTQILDRVSHLSLLKQMMLLDLQSYLPAQNLINMDKMSMRRSVEVRVPFLQRAVVHTGLALSDRELIRRGRNKVALRRLAATLVPSPVLRAPKMGFGPSQSRLLHGEQYRDLLFGAHSKARGLFATERLEARWRAMKDGDERTAIQLYGPIVIEQWFRSFIDAAPVKAIC
jgi:asparagine synthase (glutamine-hydrolysing)